jgi:hypothetical protein
MPRKWNLPLSYEPKIEPVIVGTCRQTIRACTISKSKKHPGKIIKKEEGDLVRFYIWTGRPYWSSPKYITDYQELWMTMDIRIIQTGFLIYHNDKFQREINWDSWEMRDLAKADGIIPPTGEALRDVLMSKNKIPAEGIEAQILRW